MIKGVQMGAVILDMSMSADALDVAIQLGQTRAFEASGVTHLRHNVVR